MRYRSLLFLITATAATTASGQQLTPLKRLGTLKELKAGESAIYGRFVQRLTALSGGRSQEICLKNTATGARYLLYVKPAVKMARSNDFLVLIPPGTYSIQNYYWTLPSSQPALSFRNGLGGFTATRPAETGIHNEPITKGQANDEISVKRTFERRVDPDSLARFTFTVAENGLTYTGVWHFEAGLVTFGNEKDRVDADLGSLYPYLDFSAAVVSVPQ